MAQTLERTIDPREIKHLVIAGWTGRNVEALEKHILELEALGVKRPKSTPIFYRVSADLLTTKPSIEVLGTGSTGEVEFVLFSLADGLWVGLGSDHTDRKAETIGVSLSKQMCAKPIAATAWRYDDVRAALGSADAALGRAARGRTSALSGGVRREHAYP